MPMRREYGECAEYRAYWREKRAERICGLILWAVVVAAGIAMVVGMTMEVVR